MGVSSHTKMCLYVILYTLYVFVYCYNSYLHNVRTMHAYLLPFLPPSSLHLLSSLTLPSLHRQKERIWRGQGGGEGEVRCGDRGIKEGEGEGRKTM